MTDRALTDYRVISALMQQLPINGKWSQSKRDRWIQAVTAAADFLTEVTARADALEKGEVENPT